VDKDAKVAAERRVYTEMKAEVTAAVRGLEDITLDFTRRQIPRSGPHFQAITNSLSQAIAGIVNRTWDVLVESPLVSTIAYSDGLAGELKSIVEGQVPSTLFASTLRRKATEIDCPELVDGSQEQIVLSRFLAVELVRSKIDLFVQGRKAAALAAETPLLLQYLMWFRLHGRQHLGISIIGFLIWAGLFVVGYIVGILTSG
jgi:hypothetical protein